VCEKKFGNSYRLRGDLSRMSSICGNQFYSCVCVCVCVCVRKGSAASAYFAGNWIAKAVPADIRSWLCVCTFVFVCVLIYVHNTLQPPT